MGVCQVAKKVKVSSPAELDKVLKDAEADAEAEAAEEGTTEKDTLRAQKLDAAKKDADDPIVTIVLPKLASGKPVQIQINNKSYHGAVTCKLSLAMQLREMADKVVDREAEVHVGKKYTGSGNGARGMRMVGNL